MQSVRPRQETEPPRQGMNPPGAVVYGYGGDVRQQVLRQLRNAPPVPATRGPLLLIVSIAKQTVTVYDAGVEIAKSPISSGTSENPSPMGVFSVLEKHWWHRSNIYSAAPMPYMQRITWEGVALHAGDLPGYAASHGCIRLPYDFALRLWGTTKIGTRVIIAHEELVPVEVAHPRLFTVKERQPLVAELGPPDRTAIAKPAPAAEAPVALYVPIAPLKADVTTLPETPTQSTAAEINSPVPQDQSLGLRGAVTAEAPATPDDKKTSPEGNKDDAIDSIAVDPAADTVQPRDAIVSGDSEMNGSGEISIVNASPPAETAVGVVQKMPAVADQMPNPVGSVATTGTATPSGSVPPTLSPPAQIAAAAAATIPAANGVPGAPDRVLRPGPLSMLISQRDQRIYVRKGLEPVFDAPVTISNVGRPLGTHVFTAQSLSDDGTTLRWTVVSLIKGEAAYESRDSGSRPGAARAAPARSPATVALDRVDFSRDTADRISALMSVGATLIITDQGLGRASQVLDTDFLVQTR